MSDKDTLFPINLKALLRKFFWRGFLWSINMSAEEYWHEIYQQEKAHILNGGQDEN